MEIYFSAYKLKILLLLCFIFIFINQPFFFSSFVEKKNAFYIQIFIFIILLFISFKIKLFYNNIKRSDIYIVSFLLLYTIIQLLFNRNSINNYFEGLLYVSFSYLFYKYLIASKKLLHVFIKLWKKILIIVSALIVITPIVLLFFPSAFTSMELGEYAVLFNPLLGVIAVGRMRPTWYFVEPSYCGFILGLCFFSLWKCEYSSSKKKIISVSVALLALIVVSSTGSIIALLLSVSLLFFKKLSVPKVMINYIGIILVCLCFIMFSMIDINQIFESYNIGLIASQDDRLNRIENSKILLNQMNFFQFIYGAGVDYSTWMFDRGESNGYYKLLCEYGIMYMISYLIIALKFLKHSIESKFFFLLSLMFVIIFNSPATWASLFFVRETNIKN